MEVGRGPMGLGGVPFVAWRLHTCSTRWLLTRSFSLERLLAHSMASNKIASSFSCSLTSVTFESDTIFLRTSS